MGFLGLLGFWAWGLVLLALMDLKVHFFLNGVLLSDFQIRVQGLGYPEP